MRREKIIVAKKKSEKKSDRKKYSKKGVFKKKYYNKELARLQEELVKLQFWIKDQGLKVIVIFEGRERGGKRRRNQAHYSTS